MSKKITIKTLRFFIILLAFHNCKTNTSKEEKKNDHEHQKHTNALINESSPYLIQHAHNPVNWHAWSPEILKRAETENKLVIISIGYSACHWCHVMEEESFEDETVAAFMNDNFINIKVDREERPDIDQIYIEAVQLMTGRAGWPLNCITLPNGKPVFGGTYFSKKQWLDVLKKMNDLYKNNPEKMIDYAEKVTKGMQEMSLISSEILDENITKQQLNVTIAQWKKTFDLKNGGFKSQQKFPMPRSLSTLMRIGYQTKDKEILNFIQTTLTHMAYGGIFDQIGGGFSRYSTDTEWLVPHFEKMLYDNAQLVSLYSEAYKLTGNSLYRTVVEETLNFVSLNMTDSTGAFYSALDADSKNEANKKEEGAYYVWTKEQLQTILKQEYSLFKAYFNAKNNARLDRNKLILTRDSSEENFAQKHDINVDSLNNLVSKWKTLLITERNKRQRPSTDDKSLTSWNALMISGYLDAYTTFGNEDYLNAALKNANFILENQWNTSKGLYHTYRNGKSSISGYLEDYAFTIEAFLKLYESTLDEKWLNHSKKLTDFSITNFMDEETSLFYFTNASNSKLLFRKMELDDNVIPSSNAVMANNLFKLSHHFGNTIYNNYSTKMVKMMSSDANQSPNGYYQWIDLQMNYTHPFYEVVIVGENAKLKVESLLKNYTPNILIEGSLSNSNRPLLKNRYIDDETLIYVCVKGSCRLPVNTIDSTLELIKD